MIPLSSESPLTVFARFTHEWFRLLAHGDLAQAVAVLDEPTSYGEHWSAESLQRALRNYSPNATVTDPDTLPPDRHQSLITFSDSSGYTFDCSVPLAGEWSDLTAQFEFLHRPSGFAVVLQDLHVL
jgi:hypothetical protein